MKGGQEVDLNKNSCLLHVNFESESGTYKHNQEAETFPETSETLAPENLDVHEKTDERNETYSNTTPDTNNRVSSSTTWNNQSNSETIMISNITEIEHSSVINQIHYPEVSDHPETCVDLHYQNSTIIFQTNDNLQNISTTIVDTSNDASLWRPQPEYQWWIGTQ